MAGAAPAEAAALRALSASWDTGATDVTIQFPEGPHQAALGHAMPMVRWTTRQPGAMKVSNAGDRPVLALQQARYIPAPPGWQAAPVQQGFVLTRTRLAVPGGTAPMLALTPSGATAS